MERSVYAIPTRGACRRKPQIPCFTRPWQPFCQCTEKRTPDTNHSSLRASVVWRLVVLCVRAHRSRLKSCLGGGDVLHRTAIRPSVAIVTLTICTAKDG